MGTTKVPEAPVLEARKECRCSGRLLWPCKGCAFEPFPGGSPFCSGMTLVDLDGLFLLVCYSKGEKGCMGK
eukprot:11658127-Prorocentrum_lima.AAC.1